VVFGYFGSFAVYKLNLMRLQTLEVTVASYIVLLFRLHEHEVTVSLC
jgi:hypothetical protein